MQLADYQVLVKTKFNYFGVVAGVSFGVLAGYLASLSQSSASLAFALFAALLVCGRMNFRQHQLAVAVFLASFFSFSFFAKEQAFVSFPAFALLSVVACIDEMLFERYSNVKKKFLSQIAGARLFALIASLELSFYLADFTYFFALLAFRLGVFLFVDKRLLKTVFLSK